MSLTPAARVFFIWVIFSLLQVDESVLSSENGEDTPLPPPPPEDSALDSSSHRHYPWIQMALPGGGIVSVPLERASSGAGSSAKARSAEDPDLSPTRGGHLMPPLQPTAASNPSTTPAASGPGSVGSGSNQADLLTVAAGEPVTHFNLDQLLEIVQSFQLDTTMAGHEETLKTARDLALCADLVSSWFSQISEAKKNLCCYEERKARADFPARARMFAKFIEHLVICIPKIFIIDLEFPAGLWCFGRRGLLYEFLRRDIVHIHSRMRKPASFLHFYNKIRRDKIYCFGFFCCKYKSCISRAWFVSHSWGLAKGGLQVGLQTLAAAVVLVFNWKARYFLPC